VHKCLPSGLIPSGFLSKSLNTSHSHMCATWPTHITLLELILLLHNISNCYNMKNHVNSSDGLWKLPLDWQKRFSFLGYENWQIIKLFCAHKHKPLTILSLTAANVSSTLCSRILGTPVARKCRIFHNLETFFITHALWVANELIYKNPSDIASYFKTSVPVYSLDYLSKSVRKHTNDCVQHILMWLSLFSRQRLWSLLSCYTLCSLTDYSSVSKSAGSPILREPLASKTLVAGYQTARSYILETANLLYTDLHRRAAK
jgi:hypothetical protein